jgi:hypothetical protein
VNLPWRPRAGSSPATGSRSLGQTYAAYLSLRMLIFLGVVAVCIALGLRGILAVVVSLLVSGVISYPLARRQRDAIAQQLQNRRSR